jgi:hypothetical protein
MWCARCLQQHWLMSRVLLPARRQMGALRRYRQVFKLGDIPGGAKEDLLPAIQRHFALQVLRNAASCVVLRCPNTAHHGRHLCSSFRDGQTAG